MSDLSEFLLARIAEDEEAARHKTTPAPGSPFVPPGDGGWFLTVMTDSGSWRFDGARLLAECDAKRRIVAEHEHVPALPSIQVAPDGFGCQRCHLDEGYVFDEGWCLTLRALALPYAGHPDYDEAWRP